MYQETEGIETQQGPSATINVGETERIISALAGPLLAFAAVKRRGLSGALLGVVAAEMVYRGVTGHSPIYATLGINTAIAHQNADISVPHQQGVHVGRSIYIARPRTELYTFWRNLSNLPRFMPYLDSVTELGNQVSHWVAKRPLGLLSFHWDAEIVNEEKDDLIAWRTLSGSQLAHAGSVRFIATPDNLGTEVVIDLEAVVPGGVVGKVITDVLGIDPEQIVEDSLGRFKQLMETGVAPKDATKNWLRMTGVKEETELPAEHRTSEIERRADYVQMTSEDSFPASDPPASW